MKNKKKNIKYFEFIIALLFITISLIFGYNFVQEGGLGLEESPYLSYVDNEENLQNTQENEVISSSENLKIHFLDVGQGDCALIELKGSYMLIDAGPNSSEEYVLEYMNNLGIKKFDYVIGTHAHEDHIGGMDTIIKNYDIEKILFPKQIATTKTYENFVTELNNKNLKLYAPKAGETFEFKDASFTILAPNSLEYEESNNYSIVVKFTYKENSIIFAADAESLSENEMLLNSNLDLKADVLKVGHHGSSSSSTLQFLTAINPKYAVISLGQGNDYGHPHKSVMTRLKALNIDVYRTDEVSSIVMESDGNNIKFDKEKCSYNYSNSK